LAAAENALTMARQQKSQRGPCGSDTNTPLTLKRGVDIFNYVKSKGVQGAGIISFRGVSEKSVVLPKLFS